MPPPVLDCYAVTPPGLEALTARELAALGITVDATEPGGASFRAALRGIVTANLNGGLRVRLLTGDVPAA